MINISVKKIYPFYKIYKFIWLYSICSMVCRFVVVSISNNNTSCSGCGSGFVKSKRKQERILPPEIVSHRSPIQLFDKKLLRRLKATYFRCNCCEINQCLQKSCVKMFKNTFQSGFLSILYSIGNFLTSWPFGTVFGIIY